jgi:hypothetical protein
MIILPQNPITFVGQSLNRQFPREVAETVINIA